MERLLQDLRLAVRSLLNNPTFALVVVVTLSLGIGVTTAAYSFAHWLLWRPVLGVTDPDRLAIVWSASGVGPGRVTFISYSQHADLTEQVTALSGLAGYHRGRGGVNVGAAGAPARRVDVHYVMPGYFSVLGVQPVLGRAFLPEDDAPPEGSAVAVISHRLWAGLFGRDPGALGREVTVGGRRFAVVGVLPEGVSGIERGAQIDLWLPGRTFEPARLGGYYEFVARLAPGATFAQAEPQLRTAMHAMARAAGAPPDQPSAGPQVLRGLGVQPLQRSRVAAAVRLAMIAAFTVLIIACTNVANLLLFRALMRRPLAAMHQMLGAGPADIARRHLLESATLALPAALVGGLLAAWFVRVFEGTSLIYGTDPLGRIPVSTGALGFACGVAVVTALAAGILPAYFASTTPPLEALKGTARGLTAGGAYVRRTLGVIQLALSLTLIAGAFLLVRTLRNLNSVDLGFDPRGVLLLELDAPRGQYSEAQLRSYYRELLTRVRAAPGIESAALAWRAPFMGWIRILRVPAPAAAEGATEIGVRDNSASPEYFEILNMRVLVGRGFTAAEFLAPSDPPRKIVLSETLARRLFGDGSPVGRQLDLSGGGAQGALYEVVGVVEDSRWEAVEENAPTMFPALPNAMMFRPFGGGPGPSVLLVRSPLSERAAAETVQRVAAELDPTLPLFGVTTVTELIRRYLSERILFARALSALSVMAVLLAGIGLYGLIAFGVAAHTREFGIRIALGARSEAIVRLVLREAVALASIGVVAGWLGAVALGRLIQSRLYGVGALDPATYALAAGVLVSVAVGAGLIPARAATRVDPMVALRAE